eukprot:680330-Amphidinium_carterae.1
MQPYAIEWLSERPTGEGVSEKMVKGDLRVLSHALPTKSCAFAAAPPSSMVQLHVCEELERATQNPKKEAWQRGLH